MKKLTSYAVYIALAMLLSACFSEQLETLKESRVLWKQQGIDSYSFVVNENCGAEICPAILYPRYTVTVKENKIFTVIATEYIPDCAPGGVTLIDSTPAQSTCFKWGKTFDEIFDEVESSLSEQDDRSLQFHAGKGFIISALDFEISDFQYDQSTEITAAKKRWTTFSDQRKITDYSFLVQENCGNEICPAMLYPRYKVTVSDNAVVKTEMLAGCITLVGVEIVPCASTSRKWSKTFDEIFDEVEGSPSKESDLAIKFDAERGFITRALDFEITDFQYDQSNQLAFAQQQWEALGAKSYRLSYTESCFCSFPGAQEGESSRAGEWELDVRDGHVVRVMLNGLDVTHSDRVSLQMDELYALAEKALTSADSASLSFDDDGFLNSIFVDWNTMMADEEKMYSDIQFRVTQPAQASL